MKLVGLIFLVLAAGCYGRVEKTDSAVAKNAVNSGQFRFDTVVEVGATYKVGFQRMEANKLFFGMPMVISKSDTTPIQGFDHGSASTAQLNPSPDGNYVVMDYITIGTPNDGMGHSLKEVYHCVIVDLRVSAIKEHFQSDCDGAWTRSNTWVNSKGVTKFWGNLE